MRSSDQSPHGLTSLSLLSLALFLSAVIAFGFDISYWLKYASWSVTTLHDVFRSFEVPEPYFVAWRGLQELWGYLRDAPLSLLLLVIWFLFTGVVGSLLDSGMQNDNRSGG